jgi:hypothetical protein
MGNKLTLIQTPGDTPDIVTAPGSYVQVGQWAMTPDEARALADNIQQAAGIADDD